MVKHLYSISYCLLLPFLALAQVQSDPDVEIVGDIVDTITTRHPQTQKEERKIVKTTLYKKVDKMPVFAGCELDVNPEECSKKKMIDFLYENIKYPKEAKQLRIQGVVYAKYVVMPDGSIRHPKIERGLGGGCDEEVLRFIQLLPKYTPGSHEGKPVPVQITLPVKFKLMK